MLLSEISKKLKAKVNYKRKNGELVIITSNPNKYYKLISKIKQRYNVRLVSIIIEKENE